ncbi:LysR substrate-binding domain-containing protein [Engelhardtia mirabilis]|uniref:Hydrogen peroxide-inducible genes activator n=1 Tax=Engelhardtia mirabilis TaxID=2528011 RepID=A0A518BG15_9BACT|nr:Hydrogen peroxide-inducible genes activator [Planctomycetes bacterium Pla133]QDV00246.1 Hydrogen peroxide-inducible genes activator [Planctomycetes bacterium Pla86]
MADHRRDGTHSPPNRPTVRQLEYVLAVAEHLHFRRAAEACGVTQPALSAQIQTLEELLGVQLFERNRRQVLLTATGRQVVARARDIVSAVDGLFSAVASGREPLVGTLRMGVIPTIAPYLLPRVIPGLRSRFPELRLYLREEFTHLLLERLGSGELDVALLALPVTGDFEAQLLFNDDFHVALPPDHPLAKRRRLKESDLANEDVLLLEDGHCLRDQALALCGSAGAVENMQMRATSLGTLTQMVAGGLGLTLLPEIAIDVESMHGAAIEVRPFTHPRPHREVGLVWRRASGRSEEFRLLGETLVELLDAGS